MAWREVVDVATLISGSAAFGALVVAIRSNQMTSKAIEADVLLRLEGVVAAHARAYSLLRPSGAWGDAKAGPNTGEEWEMVDEYMGFFEILNTLVEQKILSVQHVKDFYEYRYDNIISNDLIRREKLVHERNDWGGFLRLGEKLGLIVDEDGNVF